MFNNNWSTLILLALIVGLVVFSIKPELTGKVTSMINHSQPTNTSQEEAGGGQPHNQSLEQNITGDDNNTTEPEESEETNQSALTGLEKKIIDELNQSSVGIKQKAVIINSSEQVINEQPELRHCMEELKFLTSIDESRLALDEALVAFTNRTACFPQELEKTILALQYARIDLLNQSLLTGSLDRYEGEDWLPSLRDRLDKALDYLEASSYAWARFKLEQVNKTVDFTCP